MRLMTFAAGAAVGYVLGTRAGRGKYEQILDTARKLRADPSPGRAAQAVSELRSPPATPEAPPAPVRRARTLRQPGTTAAATGEPARAPAPAPARRPKVPQPPER